ncbi:MAG TPA: hypothetical protein VKB64_00695 [Gaiellaceae bacterium]|nr:hypothetical protein [Gaiellaceae bacterium]
MKLLDRLRRWWRPGEGQNEDHPLTDEEREQNLELERPDGYVDPQHGVGAESLDRIDVDDDYRKP